MASNFLVAQLLKDIPAYAALKYDDGSTLKEQYDALLEYWSKWLDQRARKGLFEEDGSSYDNYTLEALFNLRDFAEDRSSAGRRTCFSILLSPILPKNAWEQFAAAEASNQGR